MVLLNCFMPYGEIYAELMLWTQHTGAEAGSRYKGEFINTQLTSRTSWPGENRDCAVSHWGNQATQANWWRKTEQGEFRVPGGEFWSKENSGVGQRLTREAPGHCLASYDSWTSQSLSHLPSGSALLVQSASPLFNVVVQFKKVHICTLHGDGWNNMSFLQCPSCGMSKISLPKVKLQAANKSETHLPKSDINRDPISLRLTKPRQHRQKMNSKIKKLVKLFHNSQTIGSHFSSVTTASTLREL